MGRRGPLPKPSDRAQGHRARAGPSGVAPVLALPEARRKVPRPPPGLSTALRRAWREFWQSPQGTLAGAEVFAPTVARLFRLRSQHEQALARLEGTSQLVRGSTSQLRINPLADYVLKLEGAILRLESELGLTPASAARLAVGVSDARRSFDELNRRLERDAIDEEDPRLAGPGPSPHPR